MHDVYVSVCMISVATIDSMKNWPQPHYDLFNSYAFHGTAKAILYLVK